MGRREASPSGVPAGEAPVSTAPVTVGFVIGQLTRGGAERQLYELVRGLDRRRFRSIVYCLSEETSPYGERLQEEGVPLRVLPRGRNYEWRRVRALARMLRTDGVTIVHSFLFQANPYAWLAARLARVPRLITSARNTKTIGLLRDIANRFAFRASDAILCNGEAVREYVVRVYGAPRDRCVVVRNGVDLERFAPADPSAGTGEGPSLVLGIGRLVPAKDFELFIDAAALLARRHPAATFAIVGEGPSLAALEQRAAAAGLATALRFLGPRDDVPDLLRQAAVLWSTSAWEGLPNVVLEAAASGLPVVARDVGATSEIVQHGRNGFVIAGRDAEAFAELTHGLLADRPRARGMGREGRRLVEEAFSVERLARTSEALYGAVLEKGTGPLAWNDASHRAEARWLTSDGRKITG
jgi:glycosyltransferase involved in cell wall biosynthesis